MSLVRPSRPRPAQNEGYALVTRLCVGGLLCLITLWSGCQPLASKPVEPPATMEDARKAIHAGEAVITDAQAQSAHAAAVSDNTQLKISQSKNDPLKDVSPPGPRVPYLNPLTEAEVSEGWISLFDGQTLYGWESGNSEVNWSVENPGADGVITADSGPIGLLRTYTPFADYQFRCDFRMAAGGNSGVFLRTLPDPQEVQKDCYEINIVDEHPAGFLTGSIVGLQQTAEPIQGSGDWHTFLLTADGTKITVIMDGKEIAAHDDQRPEARRSGLIGLQKNAGKIEFKNIALKPLNQKPLFNGTDLTGWRTVSGSKGDFSVEDGTIHVKGGEGFLESESQHKDFVLQAQARTNAAGVNTGVFFRTETGTEKFKSNGYEMQVDNTALMDDEPGEIPSSSGFALAQKPSPRNAGTGAIFRRVNARCVVGQDQEWVSVTLVASGPRFSTFVNGYAVVHWEDTRAPDANPRKGLRLDAGHLSLQGHDPDTDAAFRLISLGELP